MQIAALSRTWLLAALLVGCAGKTPPAQSSQGTDPKPAATQPDVSAETGEAQAEPTGEEDGEEAQKPALDYKTLLKNALACVSEEGETDLGCEGYMAWRGDEPAFEGGKANAELFQLLVSANVKERVLAAEMLRMTIDNETLDAKTADRVLDAAEKERSDALVKPYAYLIGALDLLKVGRLDRAIAITKKHPLEDFQDEVLYHIGDFNKDAKLVAWGVEAAKNEKLSNSALVLLTTQMSVDAAAACKTIDTLRSSKSDFVKLRAMEAMSKSPCAAYHDKLLSSLEKTDLKKPVDQSIGIALSNLCGQKDLPAKLKDRANKLSRRITESKDIHVNTRYYTLAAVKSCEGEKGAEYVAKFKNDPDAILAGRANDLLKR